MLKRFDKFFVGLLVALGILGSTFAYGQLIYGNSFAFWDVRGPLTTQTLAVSQTSNFTGVATFTVPPVNSSLTASQVVVTDSGKAFASNAVTGSGSVVFSASPTLTGTSSFVNVQVNGFYQGTAPRTATSDATVGATDQWIINNKAGSTNTVTLPDPTLAANLGRVLCLKTIQAQTVVSGSSNVVPATSGTAGTAILAGTAGKFACLIADGTNWVVTSSN